MCIRDRRHVVNSAGSALALTPKPWTQGDALASSSMVVSGDLLAYSLAFEMIAPLSNAMMYAPETVAGDAAQWANLTQAFKMCGVKTNDTVVTFPDGSTGLAYSVDHIYDMLKDPKGKDTHNSIAQFLEEGAADLVCLMTSLEFERCDVIRNSTGTVGTSTCWEPAYSNMYKEQPGCFDKCDLEGDCPAKTCEELVKTYSCDKYYCPTCVSAGWCDKQCGFGYCSGG
eukprot:TRINITY_DN13065_c0_g1_i2.p1 TRINITY_DN13065_c0_g1~~TRINITY_DN13065_c0_g1_i2.p1  ORF type:complete len:227 (+),score=47.26 TRINITY_DN13065_c0_g1_i2:85-765(+)